MGVIILNGGMKTTIQDRGRYGYQSSGFSVSGVMDRRSATLANFLVGNTPKDPVIEFVLTGPEISFTKDTIIALTGGDFSPVINGKSVENYRAIQVYKGDKLTLPFAKTGSYGYLAIANGLDVEEIMGSYSTNTRIHIGGYKGRPLVKGDSIPFARNMKQNENALVRKVKPEIFGGTSVELRVVLGPEDDFFTKKGIHTFLTNEYTLTSQIDRMGYRLEGEEIEHVESADIITNGIAFGAVQVPAHGNPIIMLADRQTTGGYTKIANIISVDIYKLVQLREGDSVRFREVSVEEAQKIYKSEMEIWNNTKEKIEQKVQRKGYKRATAERLATLYEGGSHGYRKDH